MSKIKNRKKQTMIVTHENACVKRDDDFEAAAVRAFHLLLAETQGVLSASMESTGASQTYLAETLCVSKSTVSRYLNEDANLTLRTIAKLFTAIGDRCHVGSNLFDQMILAREVDSFYPKPHVTKQVFTNSVGASGYAVPVERISSHEQPFNFINHEPAKAVTRSHTRIVEN